MKPTPMNSRPLLDYLAALDDHDDAGPAPVNPAPSVAPDRPLDALEARLRDLEARLRNREPMPAFEAASMRQPPVHQPAVQEAPLNEAPVHRTPVQQHTPVRLAETPLSAEIDAILKRRQIAQQHLDRSDRTGLPARGMRELPRERVEIAPPPTAPVHADAVAVDADFLKFTEAVYLIGQAARRFIEEPQPPAPPIPPPQAQIMQPLMPAAPVPAPVPVPSPVPVPAPQTLEIEALSAVLRETMSAFRSVADDLAVSVGEIRAMATARDRSPSPLPASARSDRRWRHQDDEREIDDLRDGIAELQERLDMLLQARRRARS
jgi:hypothetical protein